MCAYIINSNYVVNRPESALEPWSCIQVETTAANNHSNSSGLKKNILINVEDIFHRLEDWTANNKMKFKRDKWDKTLKQMHSYKVGGYLAQSEKDLETVVDPKRSMSQHCSVVAKKG